MLGAGTRKRMVAEQGRESSSPQKRKSCLPYNLVKNLILNEH